MVAALVDDILFRSKIEAAAEAAGCAMTILRTRDDVVLRLREIRPTLVIVDLGATDAVAVIARVKATAELQTTRVLAFVSHVRADLIEQAREAGAEVLARSAFVAKLPTLLGDAAAATRS